MRGLLIKDTQIVFTQLKTLLLFFAISIIMAMNSDAGFVIGYSTFIGAMLATSSMSYDEVDNGLVFLLTLPFTKKQYVRGKYLFSVLASIAGYMVAMIVYVISKILQGNVPEVGRLIEETGVIVFVAIICSCAMIPAILKFGMEKGRFVWIGLVVVVTLAVINLGKALSKGELGSIEILNKLEELSTIQVYGMLLVVTVIICFVSMKIADIVIEKKES